MANLNFQQPPRSLANQGLSRGGFGSGGVTPTSGMFPSGGGGQQQPSGGQGGGGGGGGGSAFAPQQLSPSRSLPTMAPPNRNLFAQRTFPERRQVPTLASQSLGLQEWNSSTMSSMASFAMGPTSRSFGSQGLSNFHSSVFGGGGGSGGGGGPPDSSTPLLLDPSEFPSLTNRGQQDSMPQPSTMPGKQPYVGMVKQPTSESSEFTMSSEDFPALPGTGSEGSGGSGGSGVVGPSVAVGGVVGSGGGAGSDKAGAAGSQDSSGGTGGGGQVGGVEGVGPSGCSGTTSSAGSITSAPSSTSVTSGSSQSSRAPGSDKHSLKRGIQTSPDGKVTNIPNSMVKDQFGMVGLLTFIRAAETDPNLVSLALGQDLTALGLNLNSPDNLYPSFGGPWAEHPCRAQDIDYHVPPEYIINHNIRDKLAQLKLTRYKDDLLFFMYYTSVGDMLQLAAAAELYSRDWRYHMEEKVWITQAPGCSVIEKTSTYERGTYYFFDAQNWRKVAKEFYLDYSKLENQPTMPPYHTV